MRKVEPTGSNGEVGHWLVTSHWAMTAGVGPGGVMVLGFWLGGGRDQGVDGAGEWVGEGVNQRLPWVPPPPVWQHNKALLSSHGAEPRRRQARL